MYLTGKGDAQAETHKETGAMNMRDDFTVTQEQADTLNARIAQENTMNTTTRKPRQITIAAVEKAYQSSGGYFFEKGAMQFFDSRLTNTAYKVGDTYIFVTSEQFHDRGYSAPRKWTVRTWSKGQEYPSSVYEVGEFQQYDTQAEALDAAKQHAQALANQ